MAFLPAQTAKSGFRMEAKTNLRAFEGERSAESMLLVGPWDLLQVKLHADQTRKPKPVPHVPALSH